MDNKVLCCGLCFALLFGLGVVRVMVVPGIDGVIAAIIGLIGIIAVYLYDKKKRESS